MAGLSMTSTYTTRDGHVIPVMGLGVYQVVEKGEAEEAVLEGFRRGYRKIDTAALYQNEEEVGAALKRSGLRREEVYITTKLWKDGHGKEQTFKAFHESLRKLGVEYVDRYLIHSILGGKVEESWEALVELKRQGLIKCIGVANFSIDHLQHLKKACPNHIPEVNQLELNIYSSREQLVEYCKNEGIMVEAFYPYGRGFRLEYPKTVQIAQRYVKSVKQLMIRWVLQRGYMCVIKAHKPNMIQKLSDVFDFQISEEDMNALNKLDVCVAGKYDPCNFPWEEFNV